MQLNLPEPLDLENYEINRFLYTRIDKQSDFCVQTSTKKDELCYFDRRELNGTISDLTQMNNWLTNEVKLSYWK